jgi:hypothetical protein
MILIFIILFILLLVLLIISIELFNNEEIKFIVELDPYILSILNLTKDLKIKLKSKYISFENNKFNNNTLYYSDILSYYYNKKENDKILTIPDNKKTFLLIKNVNLKEQNINDVIVNKKTIGYYNDIDLILLSKFINVKTKKINISDNIDIDYFNKNNIDIILLYCDLKNIPIKFDSSFKIDFIDYENFYDKDKLRLMIPFYIEENIDLTIYFNNFKNKTRPIRECIQFNTLIYGDKNVNNKAFNIILTLINNFELINYYTLYFEFYEESYNYISKKNYFIMTRKNNNILEQFTNNLHGFYNSKYQTLSIDNNIIEGVPIKKNDVLHLTNQEREEENGVYDVKDDNVLKKRISSINKKTEIGYECYNKPQVKTKGLCLSEYTENNILKNTNDVWDKRCVENTDCPFYQANKNYKNYFGGCLDGYCQMPIGIKRMGYTQYSKNTFPMCHNCIDKNNFYCCDEQKNNKIYPELISPDYAFILDNYERMKS